MRGGLGFSCKMNGTKFYVFAVSWDPPQSLTSQQTKLWNLDGRMCSSCLSWDAGLLMSVLALEPCNESSPVSPFPQQQGIFFKGFPTPCL